MSILINISEEQWEIIHHGEQAGRRSLQSGEECSIPDAIPRWDAEADDDIVQPLSPDDKRRWQLGYLSGILGLDVEY